MDSILASVRGEGLTGLSRAPFDAVIAVDDVVETLRLLLRPHPIRWERPANAMIAIGDDARFRQVLEQLLENESKYAPSEQGVSIGIWQLGDEVQVYVTDDGPGVPRRGLGERVRAVRPRRGARPFAWIRHRPVRGAAPHDRDGRARVPRAERLRGLAVRGGVARGLIHLLLTRGPDTLRTCPDSFDGAGKPYRGSSYRGWIVVLIITVVVIALLWLAFGEALDLLPPGAPTP